MEIENSIVAPSSARLMYEPDDAESSTTQRHQPSHRVTTLEERL